MGTCIICGTPVDGGHVCESHQEDVLFEFRGNNAAQLVSSRFYQGTVDGYADFGVFVDIAPGVTGLLHRSELDRRLDSLDWEPGDTVCVKVTNVRDNGNIDLAESIRQSEREFRGKIILDGDGETLPDADEESPAPASTPAESADTTDDSTTVTTGNDASDAATTTAATDSSSASASTAEPSSTETTVDSTPAETDGDAAAVTEAAGDDVEADTDADTTPAEAVAETDAETNGTSAVAVAESDDGYSDADSAETDAETTVAALTDQVGESVQLAGEVVSVRQTGGPTIFELRDETGVVDCAAFVEAGVRAYPDVEVGDVVRLDGEVEERRGELQVETAELVALEDTAREAVAGRLADALTDRARPDALAPIGDHETVTEMADSLLDVAEAIRRAILESRPVVIRHPATAAGYVAGAAIERAVLPLIREEHARSDAEYHYIVRRPLENAVYDMDDATNDATQMLQDRDRHDEKLPLFCFVGAGSTADSVDGLGLLGVYNADRIVLDAIAADPAVDDVAEQVVTGDAPDLSIGALTATLAAALNPDVRDEMQHLPAVSYWEDTPDAYTAAAAQAGYDAEQVRHLREAIALEAYYQSYQDKRELITDLLFNDAGGLAGHIAEQFRQKLDDELETAQANLDRREHDGVGAAVLDTDQFTHRFDFPPTTLLLDELHYAERDDGAFVTIGVGMDELYLRSTQPLDIRAIADAAAEAAPEADVTARGIREGRIEFLSGRRAAAREAVIDAAIDRLG